MTPPARPDPVAALEVAMYPKGSRPFPKTLTEDAEGVTKRLAEAGYVLVNADSLETALAAISPTFDGEDGSWGTGPLADAIMEKLR